MRGADSAATQDKQYRSIQSNGGKCKKGYYLLPSLLLPTWNPLFFTHKSTQKTASLACHAQWGFSLLTSPLSTTPPTSKGLLHVHRYHEIFVNKIQVTGSWFNQHPTSKWKAGRGKGKKWRTEERKKREKRGERRGRAAVQNFQVLPFLRGVFWLFLETQ